MAKRRRWSTGKRLAYGLGEGTSNVLQVMMRDMLNERSAQRVADREAASARRIAERQGEMQAQSQAFQARQSALGELPKLVADLGPEAALAMLDARGTELFPPVTPADEVGTGERQREQEAGQAQTRSLVESMRPPLRRRLESTVGATIGAASSPEQLGESDIMGQILAADPRAMPAEDEPGMRVGGLRPEAYEYVARAEDKAHALRNKPVNVVTGKDPVTGQDFSRKVSDAQHAEGIVTSPTPQQTGTFAGQQESATIAAAGQARAGQVGREAYARAQAEIDAKLKNAPQLIDFAVREATAKLGLVADETLKREGAQGIARAREAARTALPIITQLQQKWFEAEPALRELTSTRSGRTALAAAQAAIEAGGDPASSLVPISVVGYMKLADYARPLLARASGQTGNPAIMEQQWAKYVPSWADASAEAGENAIDMLARLESLSVVGIDLATRSAQGLPLTGADVQEAMQPHMARAFDELRRIRQGYQVPVPPVAPAQAPSMVPGTGPGMGPTLEFNVTPQGLQIVRPPRP